MHNNQNAIMDYMLLYIITYLYWSVTTATDFNITSTIMICAWLIDWSIRLVKVCDDYLLINFLTDECFFDVVAAKENWQHAVKCWNSWWFQHLKTEVEIRGVWRVKSFTCSYNESDGHHQSAKVYVTNNGIDRGEKMTISDGQD